MKVTLNMYSLILLWLCIPFVFALLQDTSPPVVGCLLDVSNSMREALETGHGDGRAVERLNAVLSAVLKLVRAEKQHDPNALVFVAVFGLDTDAGYPPAVDLSSTVEFLLSSNEDGQSGHESLIKLANTNNLAHITKYVQEKLADYEARIVYAFLLRHPEQVNDFVDAIPSEEQLEMFRSGTKRTGEAAAAAAGAVVGHIFGPVAGWAVGGAMEALSPIVGGKAEDLVVDNSAGLTFARRICTEWLYDFTDFVPRRIDDVIRLLERLQERSTPSDTQSTSDDDLLDRLRKYMYGFTPMRDAMSRSLEAFRQYPESRDRVLVVVSDGDSTDGNPLPIAHQLRKEGASIAAVYLTSDAHTPRRRIYDHDDPDWHIGQRTLFAMADRVAAATHPMPVLASIGWQIPSSGEGALYTTVHSASALDEFCSVLLSARFGSTDALPDVMGRVRLDTYIDDAHVHIRQNPSDQGDSGT